MSSHYICNGRSFPNYEEVIKYASENGWKVIGTQTVAAGVFLITLISA